MTETTKSSDAAQRRESGAEGAPKLAPPKSVSTLTPPSAAQPDRRSKQNQGDLVFKGRTSSKAEGQLPASTKRIEQHLTVIPTPKPPQTETISDAQILHFPSATPTHGYSGYIWFALCVLLPIAIASVYYGFVASNQYAAEFRFNVTNTSAPAMPAAGGLLSMIGGFSGTTGPDNNYIVTDYLSSRQAVQELQSRIDVEKLYSKPGIDWWSRFNSGRPIEQFVSYWQSMVTAKYDMITGIATAEVRAFSPNDALLIANTLVTLSEELVNKIANRTQNDAVRYARQEVEQAQIRLKAVRAKLTDYRNKFGIIDPTTSVAASNSTLVQAQRANLSQLETQLATMRAQNLSPSAPAVVTLQNQIKSTKEQLARIEADVGHGRNGSALSDIVGQYEQLNLEVQFAQAMVTSTMQALEQARANASAQHIYITPYVRPSLPQSSVYPQRLLSIGIVGLVAFGFWVIGLMIARSIREHFV